MVCVAVQGVSGVYIADCLTRSGRVLDDEECQKGAVLERGVAVPESFMAVLNKLGRCVCKLSNPFAAGGCPRRTGHALGPYGVCTNDGKQDDKKSDREQQMLSSSSFHMQYWQSFD